MEQEIWKPVPLAEFADYYSVSNHGRVRRDRYMLDGYEPHVMQLVLNHKGYLRAQIGLRRGQRRSYFVHRLVALAFIGPEPVDHQVNHIDGDKVNNHVANLEYVTLQENVRLRDAMGLHVPLVGTLNGNARVTESDIPTIRRRVAAGEELRVIAIDYGITKQAVWLIKERRSWRHVA